MIVTISQTQNYIQDNLKSISNEIFIKQTSQQLDNIWIYKQSMERMFQFTQRQIYSTRRIYKYFDYLEHNSQEDQYFENPHMCLNNKTEVDSFCFKFSTTCGIFGVPMNNQLAQEAESITALTFILTSFRIALDHTNSAPLYYFLDNESLFYCITTGIPFPTSFLPNKRPYYIEFKQKISNDSSSDNFYFASPYQVVSGKIRIPMMISLVDYKDKIVGMVAKDIDFGYASVASNSNENTTLYVIDDQGKIFYSLLYNQVNLSVYYFNDSDITGFNTNDFIQIMNNHNGLPFQNNCKNQQSTEILCRYNTKVKDNLIIKSTQLADSPLILIVLIETNTVQQQSEEHFNLQKELQQKAVQNMMIIIALMPIAIILISQTIIHLVLKQLNILINLVKQNVYQNKREYYFSFLKKDSLFQSDSVSALIIASTKLSNCIIGAYKTEECIKQETIKYPKFLRSHLRMKERLTSTIRFFNDQFRDKVNYKGFEFRSLISICNLF
ncbi:unnamed protein product (macronuclear) [Paramecium tetraurelia]|uniref:Cache domain-containing protein n=1 Tax=Paramecium tetraurelia TaxID=5888 RepID=A0CZ81_PARTE|nr:uncharacterized protein GSPATT00011671001 [Paramecium tetraurelia]CAK76098.1 unnamed protein product [Paramecium tetraurelia]|eukprot:XP_001443495.1 hypothetical protein (macronuclear) [Paramecium tetraurelia strain d4-2]